MIKKTNKSIQCTVVRGKNDSEAISYCDTQIVWYKKKNV